MDEFYQSWSNQTNLHPLAMILVAVLGVALIWLPRRYCMWPIIVIVCLIAPAQRVVIASLDFDLLRILVVIGWMRLVLHREMRSLEPKPMDKVVLWWAGVGVVTMSILARSVNDCVNACGQAFDAIGMYFLFRCLIRDFDDVKQAVLGFVLISIPISMAFLVEWRTGRNLFAFLGGVPMITEIRDGRLRCQGAFAHPIIAGCFWASMLPLVAAQWWQAGRGKLVAVVGSVTIVTIVASTASSTPMAAVVFTGVGAVFFLVRSHMRFIRWSLAFMLIGLHIVMEAPVWHLISRVNIVGGSTGWHRFNLIDQAIRNASEWIFIGSNRGTSHWGWYLADVTNLYIVQGLHGGLILLGLFIAIIAVGFRSTGQLWRRWRNYRPNTVLAWALGVVLFVHTLNFLAISYFGQATMIWYLHLAMIASLAPGLGAVGSVRVAHQPAGQRRPARVRSRAPRPPRPPRLVSPQEMA